MTTKPQRRIVLLALGLAMMSPAVTHAADTWVDHGLYATNLTTGLDWYKLTNTNNQSFDTVVAGLGSNYAGWSVATASQVYTLFANNGIPTTTHNAPVEPQTWNPQILELTAYLGNSLGTANSALIGFNGYYGSVLGASTSSYVYNAGAYVNSSTGSPYISGIDAFGTYHDLAQASSGTFLVRSALPVPEPATLASLLSGLAVLGLWRRRSGGRSGYPGSSRRSTGSMQ